MIIANVRQGGSLAAACRDLDIRLKTAEGWITRGRREERGTYCEFTRAYDEAKAAFEKAGMDQDEFDQHLAKAVRAGSVQAMKLWWDINRKGGGEDADENRDPFQALDAEDELAKRRADRSQAA